MKMITKKQLSILQVFVKQPFAKLERKHLKESAKEKSNNTLNSTIRKFREDELIKEEKIGRSYVMELNLDNEIVYSYIQLINLEKINTNLKKTLKLIKSELKMITSFYSLVIFGSYAAQEQGKKSDLDIAVIIETEGKRKEIIALLNSVKQKSMITIDSHVITQKEFKEMLLSKSENLGKEIARKHLAVYNIQIFYEILKEAAGSGFNI